MTTETTTTPGPGGITPGRAAYEAWAAILTGRGTWNVPTGTWEELPDAIRDACDAAAKAAMMQISPELRATLAERDEARAKLAQAEALIGRLEHITTAWTRGMYAVRIDCQRGDVKAAIECLSEGLDGYDGPEWNGTETGAEWWERTKAEEGL